MDAGGPPSSGADSGGPRPEERLLGVLRSRGWGAPGPQEQAGRSTDTRPPRAPPHTARLRPHPWAAPWPPLSLPARCSGPATCLFCHGVRVQPFHFNGEYPEREPTTHHLQATAGSLPGESNVQKSLAGYRPRGREPDPCDQAHTPPATGFLFRVRNRRQLRRSKAHACLCHRLWIRSPGAGRLRAPRGCRRGATRAGLSAEAGPQRHPTGCHAPRLPRSCAIWQLLRSGQQTRL